PGEAPSPAALLPDLPARARRGAGAFLDGAGAAARGIGVPALIVLALWTTSPHPDAGAAAALRVAITLWLLAHGTPLERVATLDGVPAPLALTPLLLTAVPVWLLWRAARDALPAGRPMPEAAAAAVRVSLGYAAAGVPAILFAASGPLRAAPGRALLHLLLLALLVTLVAALRSAEPPAPTGRLAALLRPADHGALRAACAGAAAILGAGALLGLVALIGEADTARTDFGLLARDWSGRVALGLLVLALLPNLAVWAAAHGLGPGFALGGGTLALGPLPALAAGHTVGPFTVPGAGDPPVLPAFPLLAALPGPDPVGPMGLAAAGCVPLVGGVAAGVALGRAAVPRRGDRGTAAGAGDTLLAALVAATVSGALLALAA
ncbi:cell division protein PerM, partial [Streptomyces calidiresistens]|uniref:cell division protein PerM n=1 Tax=Streptomyces calidiresistens TaxID=1485586 RepID=UPI001E581D04